MTYAQSLERLKKLQKRPRGVVTEVSKGALETSDTTPGGLFQKPPAAERTLEALHAALATAAEGLPVTMDELLEAFGEEGAADWAEGYIPHCRPEFLRAFAVAVSERLAREQMDLAKNAGVHECQKYQKPAAYDGPAAAACGPAIDGVSLSWSDRTHDEA